MWVDYGYDKRGHNTKVSEPYFAGDTPLWNTIEYDSLGRQIQVTTHNSTNPKGNIIRYNALSRKTALSDPDKGDWAYTYNGLGQLITQTGI